MTTALTLATQKPFGSLTCDFYKNDSGEFYITREQIGVALEYKTPSDSIQRIHERNADRLNLLSTTVSLTGVEGSREVTRNVIVYTLRGAMEICRYSRQPKADKFMDFVWDVMESLHDGRNVLATPDQQTAIAPQTMQFLMDTILKTQETQQQTAIAMMTMSNTMSALANRILTMQSQPVAVAAPVESTPKPEATPEPTANTPSEPADENDSPSSTPASTPKPKQTRHQTNTSEWRRKVYDTIDKIRTNQPDKYPKNTSVLSAIYDKMRTNYGFVVEQEKREFIRRHPRWTSPSVINIIEENATWSEIFDGILNDIYDNSIVTCVRKSDLPQTGVKDEKDENGVPLYMYELGVVKDPKAKGFTTRKESDPVINNDKMMKAVNMVAETLHDTSYRFNLSFRLIYTQMNYDWDAAKEKFRTKFGYYPRAKADMVRRSDVITERFVTAANEVVAKKTEE